MHRRTTIWQKDQWNICQFSEVSLFALFNLYWTLMENLEQFVPKWVNRCITNPAAQRQLIYPYFWKFSFTFLNSTVAHICLQYIFQTVE